MITNLELQVLLPSSRIDKITSGKHLTTVACNDYALITFEEAWESKPSGSCPPA